VTEGARKLDRVVGGRSTQGATVLAWSLCLLCVVLAVASLILALLNGSTLAEIFLAWDGPSTAVLPTEAVSFSVVGL
jgi:hypothetical protein